MAERRTGRWRAALVALLFLASLAALLASSALALFGSGQELQTRDQLREAAVNLADAARELLPELPSTSPEAVLPEPANRRFAAVAERILANYPVAEGGFYLARSDQFAGFVPPASRDI